MKKKMIALTAALVLVLSAAVVGTVAWLTDKTQAKVNTFTVGNIDIDLTETERTYKMIPGEEIDKDPKVSVEAGSEACWLFVKVEEANDLDKFIDYRIADGWTELPGVAGVYYKEYTSSTAATDLEVFKTFKIKGDADVAQYANAKIDVTAYAIQKDGFTTPAAAWAEVSK